MIKKWKLNKKEKVFETKYFDIEKREYQLPNGVVVDDFYHINRPDFVVVLATNKKGEILLEKSYRRGVDEFVTELPAGWIDEGETPSETALRELEEETGYTGKIIDVYETYTQPGYMGQKAFIVFVQINDTEKQEVHWEDDEEIDTSFVSLEKLKIMIKNKEIKDMTLLTAIGVNLAIE